jgi:serine/threonine protein kinase
MRRIDRFGLEPGHFLAGKYVVESKLGGGWEGEVYRVREKRTGIRRALKLFFPQRNPADRAAKTYAKKLDRLSRCDMVVRYHHTETVDHLGVAVSAVVSEYVEGELLGKFVRRQSGARLAPFEALHLTYALACGLEAIHLAGEYHGDLHDGNVLVRREGIFFRPTLFDFYNRGRPRKEYFQMDVLDVVRMLYDSVGGRRHYTKQPEAVREICRGLRNDLVRRAFPTVTHLRHHLETFEWE